MKENDTPKYGRLMSSVSRLMKLYISRKLVDKGLPIKDIHLFTLLDILHYPGTSLKEACLRQACDKTTITKAVKKLYELNYIDIKEDENDRRISRLFASEKAHEILNPCKGVMMEMREIMYKGMSEDDIENLNSMMSNVHDNLLEVL
jgi:DNA-binding MarR family transcriptional regulator